MTDQWFEIEVSEGCSLDHPGIYLWYIGDKPIYAGQSVRLRGRISDYRRNVHKRQDGRKYHIPGRDFRKVHERLFEAKQVGHAIKVVVVENCRREEINARERFWIAYVADSSTTAETE